jgi:hypothetical protein
MKMPTNRSINTDVLSAGFARLLFAGYLRRYVSRSGFVYD